MQMSSSETLHSRYPVPNDLMANVEMRVQEKIHGHRFVQDQEPFMIVLETLAVYDSQNGKPGRASTETHEDFNYNLPQRRALRFLIFLDQNIEKVVKDKTIDQVDKWGRWKELANDQFASGNDEHDAFAYLEERFEKDLDALYQAVRLIRSRKIDVMNKRRWSSQFLAVTGPHLICPDMRVSGKNMEKWSPDRRFFGRGGELVYLMLNRSSKAAEVGNLVRKRLLDLDDPMNRIAASLSKTGEKEANTHIGYLPYPKMRAYERIAEDWEKVLRCDRLPSGHLFEPLFRITGLNLLVYLAERALEEQGGTHAIPFVVDLTDGKNRQMRDNAKSHLNLHRDEANRSVGAFVKNELERCRKWNDAIEIRSADEARNAITHEFMCEIPDTIVKPDEMIEDLIRNATKRPKNNAYKYILPLARASGVATTRQGVGPWFALDDSMLFALVLANVAATVELRDFMALLYERYGLVIGPREARREFERINVECYEANLEALEMRMKRLALTERLSDDCAFVTNPYRTRSSTS